MGNTFKNSVRGILGDELSSKLWHSWKRSRLRQAWGNRQKTKLKAIPFSLDDLVFVLTDICKVNKGDALFVHSSTERLIPDFSISRITEILMDLVGNTGTILMPSYPRLRSYDFLKNGNIWDVRRAPSYTGLLTEMFRRREDVRRSLHPTKSVAVWGSLRSDLISEHHKDIRPYSNKSPYFRFVENKGKAIGIGVDSTYMSFAHAIDDYLGEDFPVEPYHREILEGKVMDYSGSEMSVSTLAHDFAKMKHDVAAFMKKYLPEEHGVSFMHKGRCFFHVDSEKFFSIGVKLARAGTTIYQKSVYRDGWK